jgi:hypothetical protein
VKERQKTAADKAKTSVVETNDAKKRNGSTSDSGDDKIRKSKDIAAGREKTPDPDAVKALINNKNRNLNDIRQVYNRIDRDIFNHSLFRDNYFYTLISQS